MDDLDLVSEFPVVIADRLHAVGARRQNSLGGGRLEILDIGVRQLLIHVLVAGPLRRIAVAALFRQNAERYLPSAQDLEERAQRFLEVGLEGPRTAQPDEDVVL